MGFHKTRSHGGAGGWMGVGGGGPQNQDSNSSGPILGLDPRIVGTDHGLDEPVMGQSC